MKKVRLIVIILTTLFTMDSCGDLQVQPPEKPIPAATISVVSVSLDRSSVELIEGESVNLTATISPSDATDKSVQWQSDNNDVAVVDQNGHVTALAAGTAIIRAIAGDKTATCKVIVSKDDDVTGQVEDPVID